MFGIEVRPPTGGARRAVMLLAPACTSAGTRYLVSTMTHRLVETTTRTVLENEQIPNSERTSAHVPCCGQHAPHGGSFRNRSVLTDVRNRSAASDGRGASCSHVVGPGVHICRDTVSGVNYDASARGDNDSHGARKRT